MTVKRPPGAKRISAEHNGMIQNVADALPQDEALYDLAELFKIFGDSTRIKILCALLQSELCVQDIAQVLSITPSAVSHQLRVLKQSKLVKYRREGKTVFYCLDDDHVQHIILMGIEHLND